MRIFCKIKNKEIPTELIYEDGDFLVFPDIAPKAPRHLLIIPKEHIPSLNSLEDVNLSGKMLLLVKKIAKQEGFSEDGYKVVINTGSDGGQEIDHLHVHLLGYKPKEKEVTVS